MIEYRMMREGAVLASCLHGCAVPLDEVAQCCERPSWLEREAGLPTGTVARMLNALCREYGSCGAMAVDGDAVIGKVRFGPSGLGDALPECVQQDAEAVAAFDPDLLRPADGMQPESLTIWCVQVVSDERYRRRGIGTAMVREAAEWARTEGWDEVRALAIRPIGPLLDWSGCFSVDAYLRLGFEVSGATQGSPELLEGVQHMRAGGHGQAVREQWRAFAHLTDEEAATLYEVTLPLRRPATDRRGAPPGGGPCDRSGEPAAICPKG